MRKGTFLLILMLLELSNFVLGNIPQTEREALIALFNNTNGYGWTDKTGWKDAPLHTDGFAMPGTERYWFGVKIFGDHVIQIYLRSNNLKGTIPYQLGNLSNLGNLDLSWNTLSGSIPIQLGNLNSLKSLYLGVNQLSGSVPKELGNLTNLEILHMYGNQFNGVVPRELGKLSNLKELWISGGLSGSIPLELCTLNNLCFLGLGSNQLSGTIPKELEKLINLNELSLNKNQLSGNIPKELGNLNNLVSLNLRNNQLVGSIPRELGNLSKLETLLLNSNQLSGGIPPELSQPSNLKYLFMDNNQLSGSIPKELGNLSLQQLFLNNNQISGIIPSQLCNLVNLEALYLNNNKLNGNIPLCFTNLAKISRFNIGYNCLSATDSTLRSWLNIHNPDWEAHQDQCGTIKLISPNGGESWLIASTNVITWTSAGVTEDVKIEYSLNNGTNWTVITNSTENDGNYNWTPRDTASANCRVRVTAISGKPSDISDAVFILTSNPTGWNPPDGLQNNMIIEGKAYKGNVEAAVGDWIGAFGPGGVSDCRAVGTISANGYYFLTVRSNASSGEMITFKLFPLPSGPSIDSCESVEFISDGTYSDLALHFGSRSQTLSLVKGWNWISFNIRPSNTTLNSIFASIQTSIEQIKSQNKAAIYSNGNWVGDLTDLSGIENGIMYKVKTSQACMLSVSGLPVPYNKPIALVAGWNWVAYLPPSSLAIKKAIDSIVACLNQVKSQTQALLKKSTGLVGDLTQMDPNKGYMIQTLNACTLIYPNVPIASPGKTSSVMVSPMEKSESNPVPWKVIKGNQFNMICSGNVYLEEKSIHNSGYYLISEGPGGKTDCRSISKIGKDGSYFATILGNTKGETIHFKLYNSINGKTYDITGSIRFQADDLKTGYVLRARPITSSTAIPDNGEHE
ncbi:MAG: hypothetical protein ACM3SY_15140 [Candidatus Omnitrophota bacterium]